MWCRESPRKNPEDPQSCSGDVRRRSSSSCSALEMKTFTRVYLSWSLLTVAVLPWSSGEMYTSLLNVKEAISVERKLIDYLRTYIDHELQRLQDVRRFYAKVSDLHNELYKGSETAMANPLAAFTLIKRLHSEWLNVVYSNEALENAQGWLPVFFIDTSAVDV
uniref:Prolyl 4-hydroxylase N-terminal domain-containing protein n=1 Tax=Anabas testudineus TaxID=64144 RepID=A0A3Q1IK69_ANATE